MKDIKLFKKPTRFSAENKPIPGTRILFSPVKQITQGSYVPDLRPMIRTYLKQNQICTVVNNSENLTIVQFPNQEDTDLVSPEFLITIELTKKGKIILGENWNKLFKKKVS